MDVGYHCVKRRAGHVAALLCEQIDDIELFKSYERRHNGGRGYYGPYTWNCYFPCACPESCAVERGALIQAVVNALQSSVDRGNHERQRHPEIEHETGHKGYAVGSEEVHLFKSQRRDPLVEQTKFGVEHSYAPKQDGNIRRHRPGHHQ